MSTKIVLKELINGDAKVIGSVFMQSGKLSYDGRGKDWLASIREDFLDAPSPQDDFKSFAYWANEQFNGAGFFVDLEGNDKSESNVEKAENAVLQGKDPAEIAKTYGLKQAFLGITSIKKFNEYHGPDGKFTHGSGGSSGKYVKKFTKADIKKANDIASTLSSEETAALNKYTSASYSMINGALRKGKSNKYVKRIDKAISKFTLPRNMALYRAGMIKVPKGVKKPKDLIGKLVTCKGFVSTTTNKNFAKHWGSIDEVDFEDDDTPGCVFKILVPKGFHGVDVENTNITFNGGEDEVLLPRDSVFKITGVKSYHGGMKITMKAVHDGAAGKSKK